MPHQTRQCALTSKFVSFPFHNYQRRMQPPSLQNKQIGRRIYVNNNYAMKASILGLGSWLT